MVDPRHGAKNVRSSPYARRKARAIYSYTIGIGERIERRIRDVAISTKPPNETASQNAHIKTAAQPLEHDVIPPSFLIRKNC